MFLNSRLEPTLHVPDDAFQQDWPAVSQRVQDLLTAIYYDISKGSVLKSSEREFLLAQIQEECRRGVRRRYGRQTPTTTFRNTRGKPDSTVEVAIPFVRNTFLLTHSSSCHLDVNPESRPFHCTAPI